MSLMMFMRIFALILLLLLAARFYWLSARFKRQLEELQTALAFALERVALLEGRGERAEEARSFMGNLNEAQLKARLEGAGGRTPERYRYVASLADRGMTTAEIAEVLQISPHEAEQVVNLAQVARNDGSSHSN